MKPHLVSPDMLPPVSGMAFPMEIEGEGGRFVYDAIRQDEGVMGSKALLAAIAEGFPDGPDSVPGWLLPHLAKEPARLSAAGLTVEVFDVADLYLNLPGTPGSPAIAWRGVCEAAFPDESGPDGLMGEAAGIYASGLSDLAKHGWAGRSLRERIDSRDGETVLIETTCTPQGAVYFVLLEDDGDPVTPMGWIGFKNGEPRPVAKNDVFIFPVGDPDGLAKAAATLEDAASGTDNPMTAGIFRAIARNIMAE